MRFAPRYDPRLAEAVRRLDDPDVPIAETCRRVGAAAERLGLPRPSYVHVRRLVLVERDHRETVSMVAEESATRLLLGRLPDPYRLEELADRSHSDRSRGH